MKMKFTRLILLISFFAITGKSFAQSATDLFISEYIEGSSNNKAIELYNATGSPIDLTSGNYVLQMYFNGGTTASLTISLTGTVASNSTFIIAHGSASFITANGGPITPNQTNSSGWFNGDDAVVLRKGGAGGTIVDAIGQIGFDPGTEWGTGLTSTADNTLRRKASDCTGDTNASDAFDPSVKYDGFAQDDFSGLGTHTSSCAVTGAAITLSPQSLNFTTPIGIPSAQQSYTVKGNALSSDINITIPPLSNFGISTVSGGPYSGGLTIPAADANAGPVTIYVIFNPASPGTQSGNIFHSSGSDMANLAVQGIATDTTGTIATRIYDIQGTGDSSLFVGSTVTTEGIVTADFQGTTQLKGFYIQDTSGDGNSRTSDGIFVFNSSFNVNVGDYVRLTGQVDEYFNSTEIKNVSVLSVLSSSNPLMAPVTVSLPADTLSNLERYEGMLVKFPQTLTVTETFNLGRYGELSLSANGRLFTPTNFVDPNDDPASGTSSNGGSNVAAVTAQQNLNNRSKIVLDDASTVEDPAVVPYINPADSTLRCGTTIDSLTGILDYGFSTYRMYPTLAPAFHYAPRPAVPAVGASNVKVASFNVLNYFNGDGQGGGFPTPRGANTLVEFNRQRTKIIAALKGLNADVVGLTEIENDGNGPNSAIADLVNGLNAATASGTYAFIADPTGGANGSSGTDAIKVAIIYKPGVITPVGLAIADTSTVHNRPPLAQTFTLNSNAEKFTLIINHFKSKGCTDASGLNVDQGDGQSCYNQSRKLQANALLAFISRIKAASGDSDVISMGDYNAYEQEDPMDILSAGGLSNVHPGSYSYVFDAQSGSLDHALVTNTLKNRVTGADEWHINSDEPTIKDYNQEFNPPYLYSPDAYRSSDHDPVLVGLNLGHELKVTITSPANGSTYPAGSSISLQAGVSDSNIARVEFYYNGIRLAVDSTAPYGLTGNEVEAGEYALTAKAFNIDGDSAVSDTVRITVTACTGSGSISAEGYTDIAGAQLINLASSPKFPNSPDIKAQLNKFEYGPNLADNYGVRVRGYICAPQTGNYIFYIASDDQSELWLSTDENPANIRRIVYVESRVGFRAWLTYPTQRSVAIRLIKGARYYIETVHKEGTGTDHLSVAWALPTGAFEAPIPGSRLSPWETAGAGGGSLEQAMMDNDAVNGLIATITPNPSPSSFTLKTRSGKEEKLTVTVLDVLGRVMERRLEVMPNGTIQIGSNLHAGVYFVEVRQGANSKRIKVIRQ